MAFRLADRVAETTESTGTGAVALDGALERCRAFGDVLANGDTTIAAIVHRTENEWEVALVSYDSGDDELMRVSVLASSDAGNPIDFSAGVKDVFLTLAADDVITMGSGGTRLLSIVSYNPGSPTSTAASTSLTDVDATNLVATVDVPANGKLLVRLTALAHIGATDNGIDGGLSWSLRVGTSEVTGSRARVIDAKGAASDVHGAHDFYGVARICHSLLLTGLTPGSTTFKWAHICAAPPVLAAATRYGGANGPAVMEFWSVP